MKKCTPIASCSLNAKRKWNWHHYINKKAIKMPEVEVLVVRKKGNKTWTKHSDIVAACLQEWMFKQPSCIECPPNIQQRGARSAMICSVWPCAAVNVSFCSIAGKLNGHSSSLPRRLPSASATVPAFAGFFLKLQDLPRPLWAVLPRLPL